MELQQYLQAHQQRFLDELLDLLRIPSVSADPAYKDDVIKTAEFIQEKLVVAGADNVELCTTDGYPIAPERR